MGIEIAPIGPDFAAEVRGLDAGAPLDEEGLAEIWRAIDRYAVLVLHGQRLEDEALRAFAARFGPL